MLDFIERLIVPGPPDTTNRIYRNGKLVGTIPGVQRDYSEPQQHCNPPEKKQRKPRPDTYPWHEIMPQVLEHMKAGCTMKKAAELVGAPYSALSWQIMRGKHGKQVRDWKAEHKGEIEARNNRSRSEAAKLLRALRMAAKEGQA